MTVFSRILVVWLLLFTCGDLRAADFVVIAHPSVPATTLSPDDLFAIYLLKKATWQDGTRIVPVNREAGSNARTVFLARILRQPQSALNTYWDRMQFKGVTPPLIQESDQAVLSFVQKVPGAIGYVSASTELANVKVLAEIQSEPQ